MNYYSGSKKKKWDFTEILPPFLSYQITPKTNFFSLFFILLISLFTQNHRKSHLLFFFFFEESKSHLLSVKFIFLSYNTKFSKNYVLKKRERGYKIHSWNDNTLQIDKTSFCLLCLIHTSFPCLFPISHSPHPSLFSFFKFWKK